MIFKAILSNKAHPEYGQATIPFPIPDSEYGRTIGLLEDMGLGAITGQDCQVDSISNGYPILNRLTAQRVNVDELDYLAKRLESFCEGEDVQFEVMASKLYLSDIKDFINLTFCCQQATVITDFSQLERAGGGADDRGGLRHPGKSHPVPAQVRPGVQGDGQGRCGKCRVWASGRLSPPDSSERGALTEEGAALARRAGTLDLAADPFFREQYVEQMLF